MVIYIIFPHPVKAVLITSCLSNDSECKEAKENSNWCSTTYPNTFYAGTDDNDEKICKCKPGYEWDEDKTRCDLLPELVKSKAPSIYIPPTTQTRCEKFDSFFMIGLSYNSYIKNRIAAGCDINAPIPIREEDQTCQSHYGPNSAWNGQNNDDDGPICDCQTGYLYDNTQKTCLLTAIPVEVQTATTTPEPSVTVPTTIQAPIIETQQPQKGTATQIKKLDNVEKKISKIESARVTTVASSSIVEPATTSTSTTLEQPYKSIWTRLISWFGF